MGLPFEVRANIIYLKAGIEAKQTRLKFS